MVRESTRHLLPEPNTLALFLLAHQDDEVFVAPLIMGCLDSGVAPLVCYLTDGRNGGASARTRNAESRAALASLGVPDKADVRFLGEANDIEDGALHLNLPTMERAVLRELDGRKRVGAIYTHAWEGGHPDHDAAHVLALGIAHHLGLSQSVFQIPFYRASRRGPYPYRVTAPLPENGPVLAYGAGRLSRLRAACLMRFFPSQRGAFIRLGPFLLAEALLSGRLPVQRGALDRVKQRPMQEPLRYERHGHMQFSAIAPYLAKYVCGISNDELASSRNVDSPGVTAQNAVLELRRGDNPPIAMAHEQV